MTSRLIKYRHFLKTGLSIILTLLLLSCSSTKSSDIYLIKEYKESNQRQIYLNRIAYAELEESAFTSSPKYKLLTFGTHVKKLSNKIDSLFEKKIKQPEFTFSDAEIATLNDFQVRYRKTVNDSIKSLDKRIHLFYSDEKEFYLFNPILTDSLKNSNNEIIALLIHQNLLQYQSLLFRRLAREKYGENFFILFNNKNTVFVEKDKNKNIIEIQISAYYSTYLKYNISLGQIFSNVKPDQQDSIQRNFIDKRDENKFKIDKNLQKVTIHTDTLRHGTYNALILIDVLMPSGEYHTDTFFANFDN